MQELQHTLKQSAEVEQERDRILRLIGKLRNITIAVQIAPFAYTFIYIISLVLYLFVTEDVACILDTIAYISPVTVIIFLIESRILEMCRWHKRACILPIITQIPALIDTYIYELSEVAALINISTILLMSILLLIAAHHVFFGTN